MTRLTNWSYSQGGSHLDRGSNMVIHLANVNNGTFPTAQTVDFIANTSHQDYAMISTNASLGWLFINDYDQRYPDINATNPSDSIHHIKPVKSRISTTYGDKILGASMFGGSLFLVIIFFTILPFLFPPNWKEEEEEGQRLYKLNNLQSNSPGKNTWPNRGLLNLQSLPSKRESIPQSKASLAPTYTTYL